MNCHVQKYFEYLGPTIDWLQHSITKGQGGSCAVFSLYNGWSLPYPETTGYIIPTLLDIEHLFPNKRLKRSAIDLGDWLLTIQNNNGSWNGGVHPTKSPNPSIFNTAQILNGLVALYKRSGEDRWIDSATRGAKWLAEQVDEEGHWPGSDYLSDMKTPSYYAHAAWPMLQVWEVVRDEFLRDAGRSVLTKIVDRVDNNGEIAGWEFAPGKPAFTHTIAYTMWGLMASAEILGEWDIFGKPAEVALDYISHKAEISNGRLPGAFAQGWKAVDSYVCLTGNAQIALCLLLLDKRNPDLRYINTACKLADYVCLKQKMNSPLRGVCGGVAGSAPVWGKYMTLRYPNWAAKYHADALLGLFKRLNTELEK